LKRKTAHLQFPTFRGLRLNELFAAAEINQAMKSTKALVNHKQRTNS